MPTLFCVLLCCLAVLHVCAVCVGVRVCYFSFHIIRENYPLSSLNKLLTILSSAKHKLSIQVQCTTLDQARLTKLYGPALHEAITQLHSCRLTLLHSCRQVCVCTVCVCVCVCVCVRARAYLVAYLKTRSLLDEHSDHICVPAIARIYQRRAAVLQATAVSSCTFVLVKQVRMHYKREGQALAGQGGLGSDASEGD
jgi:hypothetical protein